MDHPISHFIIKNFIKSNSIIINKSKKNCRKKKKKIKLVMIKDKKNQIAKKKIASNDWIKQIVLRIADTSCSQVIENIRNHYITQDYSNYIGFLPVYYNDRFKTKSPGCKTYLHTTWMLLKKTKYTGECLWPYVSKLIKVL